MALSLALAAERRYVGRTEARTAATHLINMGNLITYCRRPDLAPVQMSNGLTSVFVSVLLLAASTLAQTDRQREFAVWFASHDQNVFGLGVVGFDVNELPWRAEAFETDRDFVLGAIEAAKAKTGWVRLGYLLREDWVLDCLENFQRLVASFDIRDAGTNSETNWSFGDRPLSFTLCAEHAVYCHSAGCILCNDR